MKVEMCESLFYSWLRHVKECQVVQTNWKISSQWRLRNKEIITGLMQASETLFHDRYGYRIYKKNTSLPQLLKQAEIDVVGISIHNDGIRMYAVDVAFHENGLNYGSREKTVSNIIKKMLRTAMCLYGYFDVKKAGIVFASPKINMSVIHDFTPCLADINTLLRDHDLEFDVRLLANNEFENAVLKPILIASKGISDSSELFLRSYQLCRMFP